MRAEQSAKAKLTLVTKPKRCPSPKGWCVRMALVLCATVASCLAIAQQTIANRPGGNKSSTSKNADAQKKEFIEPSVKAWHMTDDYTLADTAVVDTILAEHQVHNPIWRQSVANVTLGNLESPSMPTFYPALKRDAGNVFYNVLKSTMRDPDNFTYYNTRTPYANMTYQKGIPKRVREEFFRVLFTQNINSRANIGAEMDLTSAIGRYQNQGVYNRKFGIWASVDGEVYHMQMQAWYQRFDIEENGGIMNDSTILTPKNFDYDKAEDIPVNFMDANNRTATYRFLYSHSLDLGQVTRTEGDSVEYDVPVATAYHTFYIDRSHHEFTIDDLSDYISADGTALTGGLPDIIVNPSYTKDSRKYMLISNQFQLKLNEEFNELMHFGLRLYVGNEIRQYRWDAPTEVVLNEDDEEELQFHRNKENRVSSYLGGQLFKNIGRHITWNAGVKFFFQGYNTGDLNADGGLSLSMGSGTWATNLWAKAHFELRSPTLWEEHYTSNHYQWSKSLDREQTLDIMGGLRIPGVWLDLMVFSTTQHDRVYFGSDGIPTQKSGVTQVIGAMAREHFHGEKTGLNSIIRVAVQKTTDNDVIPAPAVALYATSYWEKLLFKVLLMQVGFDVRYNTAYYAPAYNHAIMQFVPQEERKVGNYGYFDPFLNFHLKKIRAYVKYEHVNQLWGSKDYFHTIHYPANPATFKFGLSWNFYD